MHGHPDETTLSQLKKYSLIFWDFDGVIKESLDVKADCFAELFVAFGKKVQTQVAAHHMRHGGLSRFEKMPIYLRIAGVEPTEKNISIFCQRFSDLVTNRVIHSDWVAGVVSYLTSQFARQDFILVTATPQTEIEFILNRLDSTHFFRKIIGAPVAKSKAIKECLREMEHPRQSALMIGDSAVDMKAAKMNNINFILRKTHHNAYLQKLFDGPQMKEFG